MRILLVTDTYPPEVGSGAHLMGELAIELSARSHDVTVLTCWPGYKLEGGTDQAAFSPVARENGANVIRVKTWPMHNVNFIVRGLATLLAPLQFWRALKRHQRERFDAVLVYAPPITLSFVAEWAKKAGARYVLNVQDIFPQNAVDLGIIKNRFLIGLFRAIERRAYRAADVVTAHSLANLNQLAAANPEIAHKLIVLHNWIDASQFDAGKPSEDLRSTLGLQGRFVAVYGGVVGPAQGLDVVLELARRVRDLDRLVFLIVGDGTEKLRLQAQAAAEGLNNIAFQPFIARERYISLLHSSDVGLLTLDAKMTTPVVPGKLLGYMAAGLPVLAIVNRESDAHTVVAEADCGYSCPSNSVADAEIATRRLYGAAGALRAMGDRGRQYARAHFAKDAAVTDIERLLAEQG